VAERERSTLRDEKKKRQAGKKLYCFNVFSRQTMLTIRNLFPISFCRHAKHFSGENV